MQISRDLASVWQPCSTVFSACTAGGSEVLLWLVPHVQGFESLSPQPSTREVEFSCSSLRPHPHLAPVSFVPLVPRWWVFEDFCTPDACVCGQRSLREAASLLSRRVAGQALAAHMDLKDALDAMIVSMVEVSDFGPVLDQFRLASTLLAADLRPHLTGHLADLPA